MTELLKLTECLTDEERARVHAYAERLIAERSGSANVHLNVDAIAGICQGMANGKSAVELVHEVMDKWAGKLAREER
jgi:hypothetical protein